MVYPIQRPTLRERASTTSAVRLYNALTLCLKDIDKASTFRNKFKSLLIEKIDLLKKLVSYRLKLIY